MKYQFTLSVVKEIEAKNLESAKRIATNIVKNNFGGNILGSEISCEFTEIMNTTNGHNKRLVELINYCYNYDNDNFNNIVKALMCRDEDECSEKDVNGDVYQYLMEVADDEDLKTIITFIRPQNLNINSL